MNKFDRRKERYTIMKEFTYTITDPLGVHARPAGILVKEAVKFTSDITIEKDGKSADAKRIFGLMGLGVKQGHTITVRADGADEDAAIAAMQALIKENL